MKKPSKKLIFVRILCYFTVAFVMLCSFLIVRHKNQVLETKNLPFYNTSIDSVADGVYHGKTYTSFMHLQLEVTVKDHQLTNIRVIENKGSRGQKAEAILQDMIIKNKIVVPAIEGDELGSLVFISCVDTALHGE